MKTFQKFYRKVLATVLQALILVFAMNSCSQDSGPLNPIRGARTASGGVGTNTPDCGEGYSWDPASEQCIPTGEVSCDAISNNRNVQRDKAISQYGSTGTTLFDQMEAEQNPDASMMNISQNMHSYYLQISNALGQGGADYLATFPSCNTCETDYVSDALLAAINNRLDPLINSINNDGSLGSGERSALLSAIQVVKNSFNETSSLVEGRTGCFANPPGLSASSDQPAMGTNGIFRTFINNIKKAVNQIVNVLSYVAQYAVYGIMIAAATECGTNNGPNTPIQVDMNTCTCATCVGGGVIGGIVGLAIGVIKTANGQYRVCVFPPCN